uniref:Uncharacterized protein MANES_17G086700 n=1 Tax=Rhizophora mucronata TaxID=61149 RepID=A0A2P2KBF1_RHIMU
MRKPVNQILRRRRRREGVAFSLWTAQASGQRRLEPY